MKNLPLLGCLSVLLFCVSFRQANTVVQLPPLTHTGCNVFACKVNGLPMIAKMDTSVVIGEFGIKFSYAKAHGLMYIAGSCISPQYDIELSFRYGDTTGTYPLVMNYPYYACFWNYTRSNAPNATNQYQPDASHTGAVNITYYDGKIIAGTFAFDAINRQGDVVHITDGRFDIMAQ